MKKPLDWQSITKSIQSLWARLPEQIVRLLILAVIMIGVLIAARSWLIPDDFGKYGHFRASAVDEIVSQPIRYAGQAVCVDCHDDLTDIKKVGFHKNVACEVCHGPAVAHVDDEEDAELRLPRGRGYCPLCHEYLPSRPTGFPQIVVASHNPMEACISCHDPHDPEPPEAPKECEACHGTIAKTKAVSHHVNIPCTRCHEVPEAHKLNPRSALPSKPATREFCGECHDINASSSRGIPRVDLETHEVRYVCWQCHYPHLPEAR